MSPSIQNNQLQYQQSTSGDELNESTVISGSHRAQFGNTSPDDVIDLDAIFNIQNLPKYCDENKAEVIFEQLIDECAATLFLPQLALQRLPCSIGMSFHQQSTEIWHDPFILSSSLRKKIRHAVKCFIFQLFQYEVPSITLETVYYTSEISKNLETKLNIKNSKFKTNLEYSKLLDWKIDHEIVHVLNYLSTIFTKEKFTKYFASKIWLSVLLKEQGVLEAELSKTNLIELLNMWENKESEDRRELLYKFAEFRMLSIFGNSNQTMPVNEEIQSMSWETQPSLSSSSTEFPCDDDLATVLEGFEPEEVVSRRAKDSHLDKRRNESWLYLVKWKGQGREHIRWVTYERLNNPQLVKEYKRRQLQKPANKSKRLIKIKLF